jgi:hypothetical protein
MPDGEELNYIKVGREAVQNMLKELPLDERWSLYKTVSGCEMYKKRGGSKYTCFRIISEFDFPPTLVVDYFKDLPKRIDWDE